MKRFIVLAGILVTASIAATGPAAACVDNICVCVRIGGHLVCLNQVQ
jgi:hypothetical protein